MKPESKRPRTAPPAGLAAGLGARLAAGLAAGLASWAARGRRLWARTEDVPLSRDPSGRFLVVLVGLMVLLAGLALVAALAAAGASQRWQRDLAGTGTVQIAYPISLEPAEAEAELDRRVKAVLAVLATAEGVARADPLTPERTRAMLAPWLGAAETLAGLPLPRLIDVVYDPRRSDLPLLTARVAAAATGAAFDDHRRWIEGMDGIARAIGAGAVTLVLLIGTAAALAVVFAVRAGLAAHREAIEVLHLIGAQDSYIARTFARHSAWAALRGGVMGACLAAALIAAFPGFADHLAPGLLPPMGLGAGQMLTLLCTPLLAAGICGGTAWLTVLRHLRQTR